MRSRTASTISAYALLALVGAVSFILPDDLGIDSASARGPYPDGIHLVGMVRDFMSTHADFNNTPSDGNGHYAGLVSETLGADGLPVLDTPGNRVISEAKDGSNRNIAPHLVAISCEPPPLATNGGFIGNNSSTFNAYDSSVGHYAVGGNKDLDVAFATNATSPGAIEINNSSHLQGDVWGGPGGDPATVISVQGGSSVSGATSTMLDPIPMPAIVLPTGPPFDAPPTGSFGVPKNTTATLSTNLHVSSVLVERGSTLNIDGNLTILCDGDFEVDGAEIVIPDGSSLTLYVDGRMHLTKAAVLNGDNRDVDKVTVYMTGVLPMPDKSINKPPNALVLDSVTSVLCGHVVAPRTGMLLNQEGTLFGTFIGDWLIANNLSNVHVDVKDFGYDTGDTNATLSATDSNGGISTVTTFSEWFRHIPGLNMSTPLLITLVDQGDGTWLYDDGLDPRYGWLGGFYPIDDKLMGNESGTHNSYFTYHFDTEFTYDETANQFVVIAGDADIWAFVDDRLVIDMGGPRPGGENQRIDMDRLCLDDGQTYTFRFFMAERNSVQSRFWMRTNIPFRSAVIPGDGAGFD